MGKDRRREVPTNPKLMSESVRKLESESSSLVPLVPKSGYEKPFEESAAKSLRRADVRPALAGGYESFDWLKMSIPGF